MQTAKVLHEHLAKSQLSEGTPLRELVSKIPVRYWSLFKGIELNRRIGFQTAMRCTNLHQLMRYIGWNEYVMEGAQLPYQRYIDPEKLSVSLDDLICCCDEVPNEYFIALIQEKLDRQENV